MDIVIKQSLMFFFMVVALHSCIPKKEIDPNAGVPKCNYRDGDNTSNKVFNEKFPGKKRVVGFFINGVSHMDSLRLAHADSIWEFKQPTEYLNNLCRLTLYGQKEDSLFIIEGGYAGNYIGNRICRTQTDLIFNDDALYTVQIGNTTAKKPIHKILLKLKKQIWAITRLSETEIRLEATFDGKLYKLNFEAI